MQKVLLVISVLMAAMAPAAAQTQSRERRSADRVTANSGPGVRDRLVVSTKLENHSDKQKAVAQQSDSNPAWGNATVQLGSRDQGSVSSPAAAAITTRNPKASPRLRLTEKTILLVATPKVPAAPAAVTNTLSALTALYRVGIGDVLDIRLVNTVTRESTLFTVLRGGVVEYPLLAEPVLVAGLTTDEIAKKITSVIRVIQNVRVSVSVRDYASHNVLVTGLVDNPGRKVLRREAMPLYAVIADALPRAEAREATISRNGKDEIVSLANNQALSTLVTSGDVIKISGARKQFVYVAGDVASFGEKEFRDGMTLTQALMSAGVPRDVSSKAQIARRNPNGFLVTEEHSLQAIRDGKAPDPLLQAGDRIEVRRGM